VSGQTRHADRRQVRRYLWHEALEEGHRAFVLDEVLDDLHAAHSAVEVLVLDPSLAGG
jgi:hypothetical protein